MERLINRRQQGDLGEASAIDWFTRAGAVVSAPIGHSPDYDLIVDFGGGPIRVQIKTSVFRSTTPNGFSRYEVQLATLGGNRSWSGRVKAFDLARADCLYVLIGDGRRWLIPTSEIEASTAIQLGGPKYSEFEIDNTAPIDHLVLSPAKEPVESSKPRGSVGAGEPSEPVKFVPRAEWVRIPPPPLTAAGLTDETALPRLPRGTRTEGQTRVSGNRQIVVPKRAFETAGLELGDRLKAVAEGPGQIRFNRIAREVEYENGPPGGGPFQQSLNADDG